MERLARAVGRFVLPARCLACEASDDVRCFRGGVCDACWAALPPADAGCPTCADPLPEVAPEPCGRCQLDPPAFSRLRAACAYRGAARRILIACKFQGADFLAPHLARRMVERIGVEDPFDEVAEVPATRFGRLAGDHAADRLAAEVARLLRLPHARRLIKVRRTARQSELPAAERADNVRRAFRAQPGAPARVLLVDDVATSGATVRECAAALVAAGAREVEVWCFARASRDAWLEPEEGTGTRDPGLGTRDSRERKRN
jgi:predicted amidophosphoribosyltransferase